MNFNHQPGVSGAPPNLPHSQHTDTNPTLLRLVPPPLVPCKYGCGTVLPANANWNGHSKSCPNATRPCRNGCGALVCLVEGKEHNRVCPYVITAACKHGCGARVIPGDADAHNLVCPNNSITIGVLDEGSSVVRTVSVPRLLGTPNMVDIWKAVMFAIDPSGMTTVNTHDLLETTIAGAYLNGFTSPLQLRVGLILRVVRSTVAHQPPPINADAPPPTTPDVVHDSVPSFTPATDIKHLPLSQFSPPLEANDSGQQPSLIGAPPPPPPPPPAPPLRSPIVSREPSPQATTCQEERRFNNCSYEDRHSAHDCRSIDSCRDASPLRVFPAAVHLRKAAERIATLCKAHNRQEASPPAPPEAESPMNGRPTVPAPAAIAIPRFNDEVFATACKSSLPSQPAQQQPSLPEAAKNIPFHATLFNGNFEEGSHTISSRKQMVELVEWTPLGSKVGDSTSLSKCRIRKTPFWVEDEASTFSCAPLKPRCKADKAADRRVLLDTVYGDSHDADRTSPNFDKNPLKVKLAQRTVVLKGIPLHAHPTSALDLLESFGPVMCVRFDYTTAKNERTYEMLCEYGDATSAKLFKSLDGFASAVRVAQNRFLTSDPNEQCFIQDKHSPGDATVVNKDNMVMTLNSRMNPTAPTLSRINTNVSVNSAILDHFSAKCLASNVTPIDLVKCVWYWQVVDAVKAELVEFLSCNNRELGNYTNFYSCSTNKNSNGETGTCVPFPLAFRSLPHTHAVVAVQSPSSSSSPIFAPPPPTTTPCKSPCDCTFGRQALPLTVSNFLSSHASWMTISKNGDVLCRRFVYKPPAPDVVNTFVDDYFKWFEPTCLPNDFFDFRPSSSACDSTSSSSSVNKSHAELSVEMLMATVPVEPFCALESTWPADV